MKKSIILLLGLVLLFAIPALASTPENENAPVPTSEDQQFMGLTTLSEEELMGIEGNVHHSEADGASNITITGIGAVHNETITIGISSSTDGNGSIIYEVSTTNSSGYSSYTDPNTGITSVTYYWTKGNTTYTMTWQVNENSGTYPSASTSTSTHQSGWSDAGASKPN